MLLASLRHIREIGPESNIYYISAFELFFFSICLFLRPGIYPEFKNWRVLIIWIGITVQWGIHVPAEMSLKANLFYQLYEMISWDCNVFQLQVLYLHYGVISSSSQSEQSWGMSVYWTTWKWCCNVRNLVWIYWGKVMLSHNHFIIQPSSFGVEDMQFACRWAQSALQLNLQCLSR